ncbi:hypothetical protein C8Q78DRAFT_1056431 [Trametes maxima]|nr:hypothetical protein C8Q78DRAFT_1056431 [Trametes maxima]
MENVGDNSQLTAEFVKFLNAQLKECRESLHKANQETEALKAELNASQSADSARVATDEHETISALQREIVSLREELLAARREEVVWRTRCEQLQDEAVQSLGDMQKRLHTDKILKYLREGLPSVVSESGPSTNAQQFLQLKAFMEALSGTSVTKVDPAESRVVFDLPKLQILSKAAVKACDGGFDFFGGLLKWCSSPSKNALLFCPERQYIPRGTTDDKESWAEATEWAALIGERRELFDVDGGRLVYAGTFLFHTGPNCLSLTDLPQPPDEDVLLELARRTFTPESKTQRTKAKTYLPALCTLYREGSARVRVLGLQRVGFNERLFAILRKAYAKRGKVAAAAHPRSETARSVSPLPEDPEVEDEGAGSSAKRTREGEGEDGHTKARLDGPVKKPKRGEHAFSVVAGLL